MMAQWVKVPTAKLSPVPTTHTVQGLLKVLQLPLELEHTCTHMYNIKYTF